VKSEEFFREVDEELQRDRLAAFWRRYGGLAVALAALLVLGTAAWVGWQAWQERRMAAEAAAYAAAVGDIGGDPAAAAGRLEAFARDAGTGYAALARLREAEARLAAKDEPGAVAALEALAGDAGADPLLRDLAALLAAAHAIDDGDPAALRARLQPLAAPGAPYRYAARELLAVLALRAGDTAEARRVLEELGREAGLPPQQEQRVAQLLQALGGGAAAPAAADAGAAPGTPVGTPAAAAGSP
jgi:hypothetical protein